MTRSYRTIIRKRYWTEPDAAYKTIGRVSNPRQMLKPPVSRGQDFALLVNGLVGFVAVLLR